MSTLAEPTPARRSLTEGLRSRARELKRETHALAIAYSDPRTPLLARVVVWFTVAYALSPIDLIPDPIPVLGYLDDLLIVPAGIALAIKILPEEVIADARSRAADPEVEASLGRAGAAAVVIVWLLFAVLIGVWVWRLLRR